MTMLRPQLVRPDGPQRICRPEIPNIDFPSNLDYLNMGLVDMGLHNLFEPNNQWGAIWEYLRARLEALQS